MLLCGLGFHGRDSSHPSRLNLSRQVPPCSSVAWAFMGVTHVTPAVYISSVRSLHAPVFGCFPGRDSSYPSRLYLFCDVPPCSSVFGGSPDALAVLLTPWLFSWRLGCSPDALAVLLTPWLFSWRLGCSPDALAVLMTPWLFS